MPVMVERPKSARQARRSLLIRMFAFVMSEIKRGDVSFEKNSYPFQISVNHAEAMHVRQTVRNVNQLNSTSVRLCGNGDRGATHKLECGSHVCPSNKLDDVPMFHPLGDHRKPVFTYRHSEQW
jgi:hypothetical protein